MPTYFVKNGGDGTAPTTWAGAYGSLATALTAASSPGDIVVIQHDAVPAADAGVTADTLWTIPDQILLISATNDGGSAYTPQKMGESTFLGTSTGAYFVRMVGVAGGVSKIWGITLRNGGTTTDNVGCTDSANGQVLMFEECTFWLGTTGSSARITLALGGSIVESQTYYKNLTLRFAHASQGLENELDFNIDGLTISASGTTPNTLFLTGGATYVATIENADLSNLGTAVIGNQTTGKVNITISNSKLPSAKPVLDAQTTYGNESQAEAWVYNCSAGDFHYEFAHYSTRGSTVAVTSPYIADGALYDGTNHVTWKIVTGTDVSHHCPYMSPWFETYNADVSTAITPSVEGLMINDATVANNNEVWGEFSYQGTSGSTRATVVDDRMSFGGSPAAQTSSKTYADWTADPVTDAGDSVFKLTPAASFTPAEIGMLRARVCVGEASKTLYIDPKIRT